MPEHHEPNEEMDEDQEQEHESAVPTKRSKKPGLIFLIVFLGAGLLASGIYLLSSWNAMGGGGRAASIVLITLGTLILVPVVLVAVFVAVVKHFMRKVKRSLEEATASMGEMKHVGASILSDTKAMYETVHELRLATEDDFEETDTDSYEEARKELVEKGYTFLGDLVDATVEEINDTVVPIRVFTSADGFTQVAVYYFTKPGEEGMRMRDVATEFSDGRFLVTSNTQGLDLMTPPPDLLKQQHPLQTDLEHLIAAHEVSRTKLLKENAGLKCVAIRTLQEAIESEKRQQAVKNAHRKQIGYVEPQEVRRIASQLPGEDAEVVGEIVAQAVEEAKAQKRDAKSGEPGVASPA